MFLFSRFCFRKPDAPQTLYTWMHVLPPSSSGRAFHWMKFYSLMASVCIHISCTSKPKTEEGSGTGWWERTGKSSAQQAKRKETLRSIKSKHTEWTGMQLVRSYFMLLTSLSILLTRAVHIFHIFKNISIQLQNIILTAAYGKKLRIHKPQIQNQVWISLY